MQTSSTLDPDVPGEELPGGLVLVAGEVAELVQPAMARMRATPDKYADRRMVNPHHEIADGWANDIGSRDESTDLPV